MKYLNTNNHEIYVDDPSDDERDLTKILPGEEVSATGDFADNLEVTPGVVRANSDEAKAYKSGEKTEHGQTFAPNSEEVLAINGAQAFPASEQEIVEPTPEALAAIGAGQEAAARQEGAQPNFSSKAAEKTADKLGLDRAALAEVEGSGKDGALTVADVKSYAAEPSTGDAEAAGDATGTVTSDKVPSK